MSNLQKSVPMHPLHFESSTKLEFKFVNRSSSSPCTTSRPFFIPLALMGQLGTPCSMWALSNDAHRAIPGFSGCASYSSRMGYDGRQDTLIASNGWWKDQPSRWSEPPGKCPSNSSNKGRRQWTARRRLSLQVFAKARVQAMDYTAIKAVCRELASTWVPAKIEKVVQTDRFTLALAIRTIEKTGWLRLCWHPACAHISVREASAGDPFVAESFSFGEQLRYLLKGMAILKVCVPEEWERVAELRLGGRPSDPPSKHIFVEIMGRYSNVFLANAEMGILACAYQVGSKMTSVRMVQVGGKYHLPPAAQGSAPSSCHGMTEWMSIIHAALEAKLLGSLVQMFRGVGPGLAGELISRTRLSTDIIVAEVTEDEWCALHKTWLDWLTAISEMNFTPGLVRSTGFYSVLGGDGPYMLLSEKDTNIVAGSVLVMVDDYYTRILDSEKFQQLRQQLVAKVGTSFRKAESKVKIYEDQTKAADEYEGLTRTADLLMANLHACQPGNSSIELPDFDTGRPVTIALDPRQTALITAQKLYKRSQKLKRSVRAVAPLLADAKDELSYLAQVEVLLQQLEVYESTVDLRSLEEVRDELIEGGYLKPIATGGPPPSNKRKKKQSALEILTGNMRRYTSPSGFEVLVGRNNRQNDVLTNRIATDYDIWFHARNVPGCHLLLRVPPGQPPSDEDFQFSADLAAYFSKARGAGKVDVMYTNLKHLKRVKGGQARHGEGGEGERDARVGFKFSL